MIKNIDMNEDSKKSSEKAKISSWIPCPDFIQRLFGNYGCRERRPTYLRDHRKTGVFNISVLELTGFSIFWLPATKWKHEATREWLTNTTKHMKVLYGILRDIQTRMQIKLGALNDSWNTQQLSNLKCQKAEPIPSMGVLKGSALPNSPGLDDVKPMVFRNPPVFRHISPEYPVKHLLI